MPFKVNPITGQLDYYEVISGDSSFTQEYFPGDWQADILTINHLLKTISPKVSTRESGESITFKDQVLNEDTIILIKNLGSPTPNTLIVGISK